MRRLLLFAPLLTILLSSGRGAVPAETVRPESIAPLLASLPPHPRLLFTTDDETVLRRRLETEPLLRGLRDALLADADRELTSAPVARVLIGRRLLDKSRLALARTINLSLAWRLSGRRAYLDRARAELLAVAAFADWNPSHFLDVAEMTAAVAIGYDWLYPDLDDATRALLRSALLERGLRPSLRHNSWTRVVNNWNQVCNGGMVLGALALADREPALAAELVARAVSTVPRAMHEYAPDGAYPEGPGYWNYGTTYNLLLIAALESALGRDFGLTALPGFLASADYYLHVVGPTGFYFNYADAGRGGEALSPAMIWFARRRAAPYLLWHELPKLEARAAGRSRRSAGYGDALALIWLPPAAVATAPAALSWSGQGTNPVAFHRSGWTSDAIFVGLKGGSPSVNHAHMDVGSFILDADGIRWADDLGSQDYNSLESKGINLWGRTQEAERWRVFRLGTSAHNVLQIDGLDQRVAGSAPILLSKPDRSIVDLSPVYAGQLETAHRGIVLGPNRSVRIQDEFRGAEERRSIRWAMLTRADVSLESDSHALLRRESRQLHVRVLEPAGTRLKLYPTDPPPAATDARNPGTRMIGFEMPLTPGIPQRVVIDLVAGSGSEKPAAIVPLGQW